MAALGLGEAPRSVGRVRKAIKRRGGGDGSEASAQWILVLKGVARAGFL
jgi:hypothetical protein